MGIAPLGARLPIVDLVSVVSAGSDFFFVRFSDFL